MKKLLCLIGFGFIFFSNNALADPVVLPCNDPEIVNHNFPNIIARDFRQIARKESIRIGTVKQISRDKNNNSRDCSMHVVIKGAQSDRLRLKLLYTIQGTEYEGHYRVLKLDYFKEPMN